MKKQNKILNELLLNDTSLEEYPEGLPYEHPFDTNYYLTLNDLKKLLLIAYRNNGNAYKVHIDDSIHRLIFKLLTEE